MVFLLYYILCLCFIIQAAHTQTSSESEAINRLIEDLLSKSEKRNTEPIQFTWTNQFMVDKQMRETTEGHGKEDIIYDLPTSLKAFEISSTTLDQGYSVKRDTQREVKDQEKGYDKETTVFETTTTTNEPNIHKEPVRMTSRNYNTDGVENPAINTIQTNEKITVKPANHEAVYVTKTPAGEVRGRMFSGSIFDAVKMVTTKTSLTPGWDKSKSITAMPMKVTKNDVYSTTSSQNDYKHHSELDADPHNNLPELSEKKLTVVKAIEDLMNSIPNYNVPDEKNKYEDIIKGLLSKTDATKLKSKNNAVGSNLFQILGYHKHKLAADNNNNMVTDLATMASIRTLYSESLTQPSTSAQIGSSSADSTTNAPSTAIHLPTQIEETHDSGNIDGFSDWFPYINPPSTDPHDVTTQIPTPNSDLYLLVDEKNKDLKGYFSLKPGVLHFGHTDATPSSKTQKFTFPFRQELKQKSQGNNGTQSKELLQLYGLINSLEERKSKTRHRLNWETIKKFLSHDRACSCKCKENQTICKVCAATDRVMRELTFEFNNLANYMADHCLEIQTFFWMNPSGGKKLRDSVHRIDKSLHDYYKRVRGKCTGRTCKTFATYLDKRHLKLLKQAKVKYPWISTNIT